MSKKDYKELIGKMTLKQKVSLLSGKDFWQSMDIPEHGITNMFLADGPHGIRKQAAAADHLGLNASLKATCFPTAATMANSWNTELGEQMGERLGEEAVSQKVNVLLGPGLNIKRNPLCGRNFEYFSEDPYLAGKMAASYVKGIQSNGISACLKHYAANNQEERRMIIDTVVDERTLREIYLTNFEIGVKEGKVKTVMSAYNRVNGEYANESEHLLKDVLRDDWGFEGVIVTDWGGNNDRVAALKAGNELEMPTTGGETNKDVLKAIEAGELDEKYLDEALERLLDLIFTTEEVYKNERKDFDKDAHHQLAMKCAEESIVLLKNEDSVLPLKGDERVAIIGEFAKKARFQGAGSSVVNPTKLDNTLECVSEYGFNYVGFENGFERYGKKNKGLIKKAVKLANNSDVVLLYIGLDEATETEGLDRKNMKLPQNQLDLITELAKTGKKIVMVLSCGSAIEMDFADNAAAVVHGYLSGQAGAKAVLNVITGKVNPSGKLSESYPIKYEDCSSAARFPANQMSVEYREGLFVGYRYYDSANVAVKYPFGFGLSYTNFEYSDLEVSDKGVSFTLKNAGEVDGAEVAQLYIGATNSKIIRPKKELKGFKKVFLKAGESKTVKIDFDEYTFRYFNTITNGWEVEPCVYEVMIGASVDDIKLNGVIKQAGTAAELPILSDVCPSYYSANAANVGDEEFRALLGRDIPDPNYQFYKKNRMRVTYNTAVSELKYAPGWFGRFFAGGIRFAYNLLRFIGKRDTANMLMLGMFHMPLRGLSRMTGGAITWGQLEGLIMMFNGKFFKGFGKFRKEGKIRKKEIKAQKLAAKKAAKEAAEAAKN